MEGRRLEEGVIQGEEGGVTLFRGTFGVKTGKSRGKRGLEGV